MPDPNEVGRAKITVEVDASGVKKSVDDAKKSVNEVGNAAERTSGKFGAAFGKMGTAIESSTEGVRKFAGALSSSVGVLTGTIGAVTGLVGVLALLSKAQKNAADEQLNLNRAVRSFEDNLEDFQTTSFQSAKEIDRAFSALADQITDLDEKIGRSEGDKYFKQLQESVDGAYERLKLLQEQEYFEQVSRDAADARGRIIELNESLSELLQQQQLRLLPERERIAAEAAALKDEIAKQFEGVIGFDEIALRKALDNVDELARRQLEKIAEQERLKDEAQAKREAQAEAAAQRQVDILREGLNGIFSADFTTRLDSIAQALKEGNNAVRRLK